MKTPTHRLASIPGCALIFAGLAAAQFGGGPAWNTTGGDAQRTSWVRTDAQISPENLQKPGFKFLWKVKLNNEAKGDYALSQAVEFPRYIGYRGFRSYVFLGGASNTAIALDSDLARVEWQQRYKVSAPAPTPGCPGGMTAGVSRPTPLTDNPLGTAGPARAATHAASAVGEVNEGAVQVKAALEHPPAARGPRPPAAFGSNALFVLTTDGMLHLALVSNGEDSMPPFRFLPANANASNLIFTEGEVYASTSGNCGGAPNAVWMIDLAGPDKSPKSWKTKGGSVIGTALGPDGTVYASTGDGEIVTLDRKTLAMKESFSVGSSPFTTSPVVFSHNGKYLVAAANKDGHIYILDGASLKTPLAKSDMVGDISTGELATWESNGARWLLAPANGKVTAYKVMDRNGKLSLESGWSSRDLLMPQTPTIVNGVVFALAGGDAQHPAVLYALDGGSGKELWNSGNTMTSYARTAPSGGSSQIYRTTHDSTVYAFGYELVK
jgi:outer membrane protein assembly factor BamB